MIRVGWIALLGVWLSGAEALYAKSCRSLCAEFGSFEACEALKRGERDCTELYALSSGSLPFKATAVRKGEGIKNANRPGRPEASSAGGRELLHTVWQVRDGYRIRFVLETGPEYLSFRGEAQPRLDPYGFTFDGTRFESDHYLDDRMKCRRELPGQFRCRSEEAPFETRTILYRRQGGGRFDFLIYRGGADLGDKPRLEMRLYSDGRRIYDLFYEDGGIVPSRSGIYPIAEIVRAPSTQSPPSGSGRSGR